MERRWSLIGSFLLLLTPVASQVPGLVHTDNGYDNWSGTNAICWSAPREDISPRLIGAQDDHSSHNHQVWSNPLVPEFPAGPTTMLRNCPSGAELFLEIDLLKGNQHNELQLGSSDKLVPTSRQIGFGITPRNLRLERRLLFLFNAHSSRNYRLDAPSNGFFCPVNGHLCTPYILSSAKANGKVRKINAHIHQPSLSYEENIQEATKKSHADHEGHDHGEDEIYDYWQQWKLSHPDEHNEGDRKEDQGDTHDDHDHGESSASHEEDSHAGHNHLRTRRRILEAIHSAENNTTNSEHTYSSPAPTISELFNRIEAALESTAASDVQVSYQGTIGYPTRVAITYQGKQQQQQPSTSARSITFGFKDETVYLVAISHLEPLHGEEEDHNATSSIHTPSNATTTTTLSKKEALYHAKELWVDQALSSYRHHYTLSLDRACRGQFGSENTRRQ